MKHLRGLGVLVLGLGHSGLAMARWCARHGADVRVWDSRESPPQLGALRAGVPAATFATGALADASLDGVQLVLRSPGLAPHDARIAPLLAAAHATGVAVHGELDLFTRALADLHEDRGYAPQLVAVTGTNGKTTVTSLAALLVERAGRRVAAAGNIGPTMLDTLAAALDAAADDELPLPEVWVLELSSFQLESAALPFAPAAAAVLNVTQDHLDWHGGFEAYASAKARVYGERTVRVVNRDDPVVEAMAAPPPPVAKPAKGARSCASASMRRGAPATSGWSSSRAWPGSCAPCPSTTRRGARAAVPTRPTTSCTCSG